MEENRMPDFSPDTEKNNSSKLNTETENADLMDLVSDSDGAASAEADAMIGNGQTSEETSFEETLYEETSFEESFEDLNEEASFEDSEEMSADDLSASGARSVSEADSASSGEEDLSGYAESEDDEDSDAASRQDDSASSDVDAREEKLPADASSAGKTDGTVSGPGPVSGMKPAAGQKTEKSKAATYRDKILRHKKRRYRRSVIVVIIAMILLVGSIIFWMQRGYTHAELIRVSALTAEDGAAYANLGGNVVQYGNGGAVCVDQRGNTLWEVSYEMQQPIISISEDVIAIANRSGYNVYVMNSQGLMGKIRTTLPIHSISAGAEGEVAVVMDDTAATWIRLYSADGKEIAYLVRTMEENGYPIATAVSPDGKTLCVSSVSMANAAVKTNISFYNFGNAGQKVNDHLVQHSDFIDEVIPYLHYIDNTTCVCVSDKQLFCFWSTIFRSAGSSYAQLSDNIQGVFCGDSFIGILSSNTKGESQYTLDLYNKRGKQAGSVNFTMQYTDIDIVGDKIYIHNEKECQIFTAGGRCLFNGEFDRPIRAMIPGAGLSDLLVVTDGEVDSVRLH